MPIRAGSSSMSGGPDLPHWSAQDRLRAARTIARVSRTLPSTPGAWCGPNAPGPFRTSCSAQGLRVGVDGHQPRMAHNVASRLGDRIRQLTRGSSREQLQPSKAAAHAGKASADSEPLGPEDQENPDRPAQAGGTPAEYERSPRTDPAKGDLEGGAWRTTATFDDEVPGPPPKVDHGKPPAAGDEDVDPIVHRGE